MDIRLSIRGSTAEGSIRKEDLIKFLARKQESDAISQYAPSGQTDLTNTVAFQEWYAYTLGSCGMGGGGGKAVDNEYRELW